MRYWKSLEISAYAQLIERLESEGGLPSSGTVVQLKHREGTKGQHRVSYMGQRVTFYIAREDPDMKGRLRRRSELCSTLVVNGCNQVDHASASTLELLDASGCFYNQNAVLVGSHAFGVIGNMLGVTWESDMVATEDIDLGRFIRLAGTKPIDLGDKLKQAGFRVVPGFGHKDPPTSFMHDSSGMKVDFLTPLIGKPTPEPAKLTGMDVYAEKLRFFDYLITNTVRGAVITRNGILVQVPQPARYAFHKCLIAPRRDVSHEAKRKKDISQAEALFGVLIERRISELQEAWDNLEWKDKAKEGLSMMRNEVKEELFSIID
ncbi:GSU2403 family nucleotidyltransferase fold protein [Pseudomonadota bacterium]